MAPTLEDLEKKRDVYQKRIVGLQANIVGLNTAIATSSALELYSIKLKEISEKLETLYEETCLKCPDDFDADHLPHFETLFNSVENLQIKIMELQKAAGKTATKTSPSFKLERIKLPQFSGNYSEWPSFFDLFKSSVDQNSSLSGAEKMIHLKSCLTGDAAAIVSSFQSTNAHYTEAWKLVSARYDNKREVIFAHLQKFIEVKAMQNESAVGLRAVVDALNECVRSLKVLAVPVEHWDLILVYLSLKKLDTETRKQWSLDQDDTLPTVKEFIEFTEARALALSSSEPSSFPEKKRKNASSNYVSNSRSLACVKCSEAHHLHTCQAFLSLSTSERNKFVSQNHLCYNCLFKGHSVGQCKMRFSCSKCGKKHHTLLHSEAQSQKSQSTPVLTSSVSPHPSISGDSTVLASHCTPLEFSSNVVLMGTLIVTADNSNGQKMNCRVFLDPGSEIHFISEQCVSVLGLKRKKACITVEGVGGVPGPSVNGVVNLRLNSKVQNFSLDICAIITPKVTGGLLPRAQCKSDWDHLKNLQLSDPQYFRPGPIDILLGAKVSASIMLPDIVSGPVGAPWAQNTKFGWMLSGDILPASKQTRFLVSAHDVSCRPSGECVDTLLEKFWVLEEPDSQEVPLSVEDEECEKLFKSTYQRGEDGRYTVLLPFKPAAPTFGNSRRAAVQRFLNIERQLSKQPTLKDNYVAKIRESIHCEYLELVPPEDLIKSDPNCYYMPHHVVVKESSETTKYRIVFDASAKTTSGCSLNETLMTGPKLQIDLLPLLIGFRSHIIAMSADIHQFYHQVRVHPNHVDFQRLVWRETPDLPLQDYRMVRVTFGVTSAPYLAIRCLHQLADDESKSFPLASQVLKEEFLVDNLLSGAPDIQTALALQEEVCKVMAKGNLKLRQWMSNSPSILESLPPEHKTKLPLLIGQNESVRTIGLLWQPQSDTFAVNIVTPDLSLGSSKRKVLSSIARIFDPLGLLSPVTIKPKILMQEIWKSKLSWDEPLPPHLHTQWISYCKELQILETFRIERCIASPLNRSSENVTLELHGFSDASKSAYSACVYIRTIDSDGISVVNLVAAKAKVAPVKFETIPRLELCGAVLLTKLSQTVRNSLKFQFSVIRCWTDSTIVLDWLVSKDKLPIFVNNRIRKIEKNFPQSMWHHVAGEDNPADAPSRGISASSLINHPLWLKGPAWLSTESFPANVSSMTTSVPELSAISKFVQNCSTYSKMKRVVAYCLRFIKNSRTKIENRLQSNLSVIELSDSLHQIVCLVQADSFHEEIGRCQKNQQVKSNVKFLVPFLDKDGVLRVGGRLDRSSLSFGQKHPILLPRNHNFTTQLIRHFHLTHLHAGPQLLLAIIRSQFWIIRGPDVVRQVVRKCVVCHRHSSKTLTQLMGQLPNPRSTPSRPFSQCGLDYAGPFFLCLRPGRRPTIIKSYVCLFVCMATRAIHLECASDLSTEAFVAALTRFTSRRGLPSDIYCDGGKNFIGAKNDMNELKKLMQSKAHQNSMKVSFVEKGVNYHINPPSAPHHGGLWEAGVKSMKFHLKRVIADRHLSIEEFSTLLVQVEACLNSRPITQMSSDPNDLQVLTPGHFLIGDSLHALPQHDLTNLKISRLGRWQATQHLVQHFWKRWHSEYLSTLQARPKWYAPFPNIEIGTLVLICDDSPDWGPLKWTIGRVTATFPGADGKVRVCEVTTNKGVYKRPIVKLSALPIYD